MKVYNNISELLTLAGALLKDGRSLEASDLSIIKNASLVFNEEHIIWSGLTSDLPEEYKNLSETFNLAGYCITPSLVDSHTHLIFGGNRAGEYMDRLNGADYQAIAKAGGGILFTMSQTNTLSDDELFNLCVSRIETISNYGVSTIEIKSGYSLTYEGEYRLSLIIKKLKEHFKGKVHIFNTFMAAHAIPKNFNSSTQYITEVVIPLMHKLNSENVIDAIDIFHEVGYFTFDDTELLFKAASKLDLPVKIHADEFNDNKGAVLACKFNALSADHLLTTGLDGISALANSSTVATLLPGTGLFLGKKQANAKLMLEMGCKVSIASDFNPGSCHCDNVLMLASICAPMYPLNLAQMWAAITLNAAAALGLNNQGALVPNFNSKFSIFKCSAISEITYNWGKNLNISRELF